ncbi:MAG: universal stress protein [Micromonosporaceae bacterium]
MAYTHLVFDVVLAGTADRVPYAGELTPDDPTGAGRPARPASCYHEALTSGYSWSMHPTGVIAGDRSRCRQNLPGRDRQGFVMFSAEDFGHRGDMTQQIRHLRNHVVVGTDGSEAAIEAIVWAGHEAALRHLPLRVVHGFMWPQVLAPIGGSAYLQAGEGLREAAAAILAEGAAAARAAEPDIDVDTSLVEDSGPVALLTSSRDAALVVVGSRGLGGFGGLVIGSTAVQLAMYASCPVVVVRGDQQPGASRPVVVGVDASEHSIAALGFGYDEAAVRGAPLHAVHAWNAPVSIGPGDMLPPVYDEEVVQQEETRLLSELLAGWSEKYPDVVVNRQVVRGRPRHALVEASKDAQLLVVGARGVGGFRGLLFGSVSQAMLHHAHCPVAVVRAPSH